VTAPITDADRAAWQKACEEATPGPWVKPDWDAQFDGYSTVCDVATVASMGAYKTVAKTVRVQHQADARFIALARTAVPVLLAENARLAETNTKLNRRCQAAESVANKKLDELRKTGQQNLGRALANYAAELRTRELVAARTEAAQLREQVEALGRERDQMQRQVENLGDMLGMIRKAGR
jgi:hypothetical protein